MSKITFLCLLSAAFVSSENNFDEYFQKVDYQLGLLNADTAELAWNAVTTPKLGDAERSEKLNEIRSKWKIHNCLELKKLFPGENSRKLKLLCRGPIYTKQEVRELSAILEQLRQIYKNGQVCVKDQCFHMEPDLAHLMATVRDPEILKELWISWRNQVGPQSKPFYSKLVVLLNSGARRNGYEDIGESWREELEIPNLEIFVDELMKEIMPLYTKLHAVVRFKLRQFYGPTVPEFGTIPEHLMGNMWGQNWENLIDIIYNDKPIIDISKELKKQNFTVDDLVRKSEEFYKSIGMQGMTKKFLENSKLENVGGTCHGTSVNMFQKDDFRMILCAEVSKEDLHVMVHEMGHIQYFMEYQNQLNIFKDGASSAMQEAIGEAVAMAFFTPANLQRILKIQDYNKDFEFQLLLRQGLKLLPQIPFSLIMDKWRWTVFRGDVKPEKYNEFWWNLKERYQGVSAPVARNEDDFDPVSKFHISDNTPYIRYFLATILQVQLFESLCKGAVFNDSLATKDLPLPLHSCDVFGFPEATKTLRNMMKKGSSINFTTGVFMATEKELSWDSLKNYFSPLENWLTQQIELHNIHIGW